MDARAKDGPIRNQLGVGVLAFGGNNTSGPIEVATACQAHAGPHGRLNFESETFIAAIQGAATRENPESGPDGIGCRTDGAAYTLEARAEVQAVAFDCKGTQVQIDESGTAPTLRSMNAADGHANGGGQLAVAHPYTLAVRGRGDTHQLEYRQDGTANAVLTPNGGRAGIGVGAVAFTQNQREEVRLMDAAGALAAEPGMKQQTYVQQGWAVRRLTPLECTRLQGFPDDYFDVPTNKPFADGPVYKMLGNSMAVNVMRWIGERIAAVEALP